MPIIDNDKKIEPNDKAEVWRFWRSDVASVFFASEELYFRRTDLYENDDPNEGLPTDNYLRTALIIHYRTGEWCRIAADRHCPPARFGTMRTTTLDLEPPSFVRLKAISSQL